MDLSHRGNVNLVPKARDVKVEINEQDYIKLNSFCTIKESDNKTKRQPTKWEMIFTNNSSIKRLISKCIKNSCNSIPHKQCN